ncbi:hypothetical protein Z043_125730, partial [Scleropages formosus]
ELEIGIMARCTILPLALTMAIEVIVRSSKRVVGGMSLKDGTRLLPYMDDMTMLTTTVPCTRHLLTKLNENLKLARLKVKPNKCRSLEREQVKGLREDVVQAFNTIDKSFLPGKLKVWCLPFGILPHISMVEEFKCANVGLELTLSGTRDPVVRSAPIKLKAGRRWNPHEAVGYAQRALEHRDVVGQVQVGRAGLGAGDPIKLWRKGKLRKMVTGFICEQKEETRWAIVTSHSAQGRCLAWDQVEKRGVICGRWTPVILNSLFEPPTMFFLLHRILVIGYGGGLQLVWQHSLFEAYSVRVQSQFISGQIYSTWRHNEVLKNPWLDCWKQNGLRLTLFRDAGEITQYLLCGRGRVLCVKRVDVGEAQDWKLVAEVGKQLQMLQCIATTALRPNLLLYSNGVRVLYLIELTIPFEDTMEDAFERKKL